MAERKSAENVPSFAFEMLRKVLRDLPAGILLVGPDGKIRLVNKTAAALLSRPERELIGTNVFEDEWTPLREDGTPYGRGESPLIRALTLKLPVRNVVVGVPGPGEPTWLLMNAEPELTPDGELTQVICSFLDVTEGRRAEEEIEHLAYHDSLTGLPNRLLFADRIEVALSKARYSREPLMVLVVDIDRFKMINDSLDHRAGDTLLQQFGARLRHCVQDGDTVARLGGDQFLILMPRIGSTVGHPLDRRADPRSRAAPLPHRRARAFRDGVARHQPVSRRRRRRRDAPPVRRHGDEPGQTRGAGRLHALPPRHERPGARADEAGDEPSAGPRADGVPPPLPAPDRPQDGEDRRRRGAAPMAPRRPGGGAAVGLHLDPRRDGPHRHDRRVGPPDGLRPAPRMARGGLRGPPHRGQPLGPAVPARGAGRPGPDDPEGDRDSGEGAPPRDHRERRHGARRREASRSSPS